MCLDPPSALRSFTLYVLRRLPIFILGVSTTSVPFFHGWLIGSPLDRDISYEITTSPLNHHENTIRSPLNHH
jgi:hypothetical protein